MGRIVRRESLIIVFVGVLAITLAFTLISDLTVAYTGPSCACSCSRCDGRCWQCARIKDNNFTVRQLPYHYSTPSGSCLDSMDGRTIRELPFKVDGERYDHSPGTVRDQYCVKRWCPGPSRKCDYEITIW